MDCPIKSGKGRLDYPVKPGNDEKDGRAMTKKGPGNDEKDGRAMTKKGPGNDEKDGRAMTEGRRAGNGVGEGTG